MYKLTAVEKKQVHDTLKKLFHLKDKYTNDEQVKVIVEYFTVPESKYSLKQLLAGIDRLRDEEIVALDNIRIEQSVKALIKKSMPVDEKEMSKEEADRIWKKTDALKNQYGAEWFKHWYDDEAPF